MQVTTIRSDGCLSYLLASGGEAAILDPTRDTSKYRAALAAGNLKLAFVIDSHTHADHLSGARKLADETGAKLVMSARHVEQWRAAEGRGDALGIGDILRANAGVHVDHVVRDGETLELGGEAVRFLEAPGHTRDSLVVRSGDRAFTGDTLLIGQTGRCDLPGGDPGLLHDTLFGRLKALPDETFLYPGHDYQGQTVTALGFERANNRFLQGRSRDEFAEFCKTAFPTLTGAGMQCGATTSAAAACSTTPAATPADPFRDIAAGFMDAYFFASRRPEDIVASRELQREREAGAPVAVLDVREPAEYAAGHIEGAVNLSVRQMGPRLEEVPWPREARIVTVCKAGRRSAWAAMFLRVAGFRDVRSMEGGMLAWEREGLPAKPGERP